MEISALEGQDGGMRSSGEYFHRGRTTVIIIIFAGPAPTLVIPTATTSGKIIIGSDFQHPRLDPLTPRPAHPARMHGRGQRVRVVRVHPRAPDGASGTDAFAVRVREVEARDADSEGAVGFAVAARDDVLAARARGFRRRWGGFAGRGFEGGAVEDGAEVAAGEVLGRGFEGAVVDCDCGDARGGWFRDRGSRGGGFGVVVVDGAVGVMVVVVARVMVMMWYICGRGWVASGTERSAGVIFQAAMIVVVTAVRLA